MFLLTGPEKLLVMTFLVTVMLSVGLRTTMADLRSVLTSAGLMVRLLLANLIVVPLVGIVLTRLVPLPAEAAGALVLLACMPGGLTAIQFTSKVKGEAALAGAGLVILSLLALLLSPLVLRLAQPPGMDLAMPYGRVIAFVALGVLLPLALGIALNGRAPGAAPKLAKLLGLVSVLLFVAFMVASNSYRKEALASIGGPAVGVMVAFVVLSMAAGWLLGGGSQERRQLFAVVTSIRNVAMCLLIARNTPSADAVTAPLVAFSLLMVPLNLLLTLFGAIRARKAAARAAVPMETRAS